MRPRSVILVLAGLLALRLPFLLLPELGRDEAAYLYWSHDPRWPYAPLLQILLGLTRALPLPGLVAARGVPLLASVAVGFFLDRWLRASDASSSTRLFALVAVLASPWAVLTGSLVHPDMLLLAATLAAAWCARREWILRLVIACLFAVAAKPTGWIVTAVALTWLIRRRAFVATGLLVVASAPGLLAFDADLLHGIMDFARPTGDSSRFGRVGLLFGSAVILGGPALVLGTFQKRAWDFARITAVAFLGFFGLAAVVTGQAKGNWILPAFVLLGWAPALRLRGAAIAITVLTTVVFGIGFARPDLVRPLENSVRAPAYLSVAGSREARVASARTWTERLSEYRGGDAFAAEVLARLGPRWPDRIVSDDYGLAAQLAVRCPNGPPRLVLPKDPVFARVEPERGDWVVAARLPAAAWVSPRWHVEFVATVDHPSSGLPVSLGHVVLNEASSP